MPTREELHNLIDSLPEEAIEAAYQALSQFQVWPPPLPPQIEESRQGYEKRLKEFVEEAHVGVPVTIGGGTLLSKINLVSNVSGIRVKGPE
jgi:hypothetical protein